MAAINVLFANTVAVHLYSQCRVRSSCCYCYSAMLILALVLGCAYNKTGPWSCPWPCRLLGLEVEDQVLGPGLGDEG